MKPIIVDGVEYIAKPIDLKLRNACEGCAARDLPPEQLCDKLPNCTSPWVIFIVKED